MLSSENDIKDPLDNGEGNKVVDQYIYEAVANGQLKTQDISSVLSSAGVTGSKQKLARSIDLKYNPEKMTDAEKEEFLKIFSEIDDQQIDN